MATVLDALIRPALRMIGQLGPGRGAGPAELVDALGVLNRMLDAWSTERLNVYTIRPDVYNLIAGQQTYTIGPGGDFNAPRPVRIEEANLRPALNPDQRVPLEVKSGLDWSRQNLPPVTSTMPGTLYYDAQAPLGNIRLWPVPLYADQLELFTWQQLGQFNAVSDTVALPPGYADAIASNLACKLAPEWGRPIRPDVYQMAVDSKARIQSLNTPALTMTPDSFGLKGRGFSILTG